MVSLGESDITGHDTLLSICHLPPQRPTARSRCPGPPWNLEVAIPALDGKDRTLTPTGDWEGESSGGERFRPGGGGGRHFSLGQSGKLMDQFDSEFGLMIRKVHLFGQKIYTPLLLPVCASNHREHKHSCTLVLNKERPLTQDGVIHAGSYWVFKMRPESP